MTRWEWLVNHARLEVHEFSIDRWKHYSVENRRFPFYVMSYIQEGGAEAIIEGQRFSTPAGSLLLTPANARHSHFIPEGSGPTTFLWWHFSITVGGLDLMQLVQYPIVLQIHNRLTFENMFYSYREFYSRSLTIPSLIYRRAKEYEIMAFLFENILDGTQGEQMRINAIPEVFFGMMQDIIEHPERNTSLQELSRKYYLNATYISNRFKKLFGISPIRLHNQVVIKRARDSLSEDESCPISELAKNLGFNDISTFTHFFSTHVGCSPTEYRKRYFN